MDLACLLAKRVKGSVEAVFVIEVNRSLPIDAELQPEIDRGEEVLQKAADVARECAVTYESALLQARDVGAAIVDEAVQVRADAIVMGLPYKRRFGEFDIGPCVQYVLRNAPCRVLIARQQIES
ncbi:MAG: universal stress protein [Chloroflexota bacterium]|nr:MAG: universal stress protein [Chloroflexota bacterium]